MDRQTQLKIMVLISGRTPAAICRQFQREKWEWTDTNIVSFITLSLADKQKTKAEGDMQKVNGDNMSQ